ncbi:NTP transferase domain-containing protein [Candidatus Pacearchaeota archaeon]|nr:NTP transferase domain-containing protein [Candidatus Pacearchaeota archaeon]
MEIFNKYRVVVLTAGQGLRLGNKTKNFNKCLLKVGNKAVISYTIDSFPKEVEFVIALGYRGSLVKQYLEIVYPERKFIFVDVDKFKGPGSGPGYSLLSCQSYLQCPFYFVSCDAIVFYWQYLLRLRHGWSGYCEIDENRKDEYCTIKFDEDDEIIEYFNKTNNGTKWAFTGVAYIKEYKEFWNNLKKENISIENELQVAPAILKIRSAPAVEIEWVDTGNEEGLQLAKLCYNNGIQNLDKEDEEIYFLDDYVIKYFCNESIVNERLIRTKYLNNIVPQIIDSKKNFYKYEFINGKDLFGINNLDEIFLLFLNTVKSHFWNFYDKIELNEIQKIIFKDACKHFYYDKTISRLNKLYEKVNIIDQQNVINGKNIPLIKDIFELIDWEWLCSGFPSRFHGDLALGNIIHTDKKEFKFIDWRQDFSGLIEYGDIYYDFAKLYASLLWSRNSIKDDKFFIKEKNNKIDVNIEISESFINCLKIFDNWLIENNFSLRKTKILSHIVLLNMSPLHENPLDRHLFYYAKWLLYKELERGV